MMASSSWMTIVILSLFFVQDVCSKTHGKRDEDFQELKCNTEGLEIAKGWHKECQWAQIACQEEGFLNYHEMYYCNPTWGHWRWLLLGALAMLVLYTLGDLADSFFSVALERISTSLKLSPNVAGVTFLALGNGAPDISAIIIGVSSGEGEELGCSAPAGGGMFVTCVVMAMILFVADVQVCRRPFIRDVVFYLLAIMYFWYAIGDKLIYWYECLGMLVLYLTYVLVVVLGRYVYQNCLKLPEDLENFELDWNGVDVISEGESVPEVEAVAVCFDMEAPKARRSRASRLEFRTPLLERGCLLHKGIHEKSVPNFVRDQLYRYYIFRYRSAARAHLFRSLKFDDTDCESVSLRTKDMGLIDLIREQVQDFQWEHLNYLERIQLLIYLPIQLVLKASIPPASSDPDDWEKLWASTFPLCGPLAVMFILEFWEAIVCGPILGVGLILSFVVYWTTSPLEPPKWSIFLAISSFIMAIVWIYFAANEAVNIIGAFGVILNLPETILSVTVLAWANSLGDIAADIAVAKAGQPSMAVGAIYGGPILTMLIGLGTGYMLAAMKDLPEPMPASGMTPQAAFSFLCLMGSLMLALIIVPCMNYRPNKVLGVILLAYYTIYLACMVTLSEDDLLWLPWTNRA